MKRHECFCCGNKIPEYKIGRYYCKDCLDKQTNNLNFLVGKRYKSILDIKAGIERNTEFKIENIVNEGRTSASDEFGTDYEILIEFASGETTTIFYLVDNAMQYYITEV